MNNRGVYAIRDNKGTMIQNDMLMVFPNNVAAIRFFTDVASDPKSPIHKHIADYDLIYIGGLNAAETGIDADRLANDVVVTGADVLSSLTKENDA